MTVFFVILAFIAGLLLGGGIGRGQMQHLVPSRESTIELIRSSWKAGSDGVPWVMLKKEVEAGFDEAGIS